MNDNDIHNWHYDRTAPHVTDTYDEEGEIDYDLAWERECELREMERLGK